MMMAVSANATIKRVVTKDAKPMAVKECVKAQFGQMNAAKPATLADLKKFSNRADAGASTFILDYKNWDRDFTQSTTFTMEAVPEGTIELDQYDKDETTGEYPTFTYNVKIKGFTDSRATVYGYYDQTEGQIRIPVQTMFNHKTEEKNYGRIVLTGLVLDSEDNPVIYGYEIFLDVDKDGNVTLSDEEFDIEDEESSEVYKGCYVGGFYSIMPDSPGTSGNPGVWNYGFEAEVFTPNAVVSSYETHLDGGWTEWAEITEVACIEDWGNEVVVHNFLSEIPVSLTKNGDSYSLNLPAILSDFEYSIENGAAFEAGFMQIWRGEKDGTGVTTLLNTGAITGTLYKSEKSQGIRFYDTEHREAWTDDEGEHAAGEYIINPSYFYLGTLPNESGARYWEGERVQLIILADEGVLPEPAGIKSINADGEKGNSRTFNLMGQQVSANAKGLVIRDGKKLINK